MEECAHCGKRGDTQTIRLCTGCKAIRYCSRDCQKGDWARHKAACKKAKHNSRSGHTDTGQSARTEAAGGEATAAAHAESSGSGPLVTCKKCGRQGREMRWCGKCQEVTYCSRDCQRGDWKVHKDTCKTVDVVTTAGFRKMKEKEEAERRAATEREEASRRRQHEALASLLSRNLRLTPAALTWEEARSRARRLYPGKKIVDRFRDLPNDRVVTPAAEKIVAVVRIKGVYPHFFRPGRCLEDSQGETSFVLFYNEGQPTPYFRYDQLRDGNFLCYEHGHIHFFMDGTVGFRIDNPEDVHIMEP